MIVIKETQTKNNIQDMQQWTEEGIYEGVNFLVIKFTSKEIVLMMSILNLNIIITWVERKDRIELHSVNP